MIIYGERITSDMTEDEIFLETTGQTKKDFLLSLEENAKKRLKNHIKEKVSNCEDMEKLLKIFEILNI